MKKLWALLLATVCASSLFSQENNSNNYGELKGGFKQENIFIGGSINLGLGGGQLTLGASPEIGYTFTQWLDAGVGLNFIYTSVAANTYYNPTSTKLRQFNYGGGPFVRIYPVNFLFLQGQFEENWTRVKVIDGMYSAKQTVSASSFIAGIGYTQRMVGQGSYYLMIGLDLLNNPHSPYVYENNVGQLIKQPIIRGGFNFYLHPARGAKREARYQNDRTL